MPDGVIARVSLLVWIALLLATALAAVIAMATLHDTVGFALAGGALVATVVAALLVVRAELTEEEPSPATPRPAHRRLAGGLALLVAVGMLVIATVVVSRDQASSSTASDGARAAVQTVRDYVTAATLDRAGEAACNYLTLREQQLVARLAGPEAVCRDAFSDTQPASTVPGSVHAIQALAATATVRHGQARVILGQGSGALSFVLRRATTAEGSGYEAPPSDWRITAGATAVLAP
jgi:hypothetical protein